MGGLAGCSSKKVDNANVKVRIGFLRLRWWKEKTIRGV